MTKAQNKRIKALEDKQVLNFLPEPPTAKVAEVSENQPSVQEPIGADQFKINYQVSFLEERNEQQKQAFTTELGNFLKRWKVSNLTVSFLKKY